MTKRVLSIVGAAYRGTVEEQDDTILWLMNMCSTAGLDVSVLLSGNAVNYAVRGQDASGLAFGDVTVAHPPALDNDLADLIAAGVPVHYVSDDVAERGLPEERLIAGVKPIASRDLPQLLAQADLVWRW
jgi:hypothetical protein